MSAFFFPATGLFQINETSGGAWHTYPDKYPVCNNTGQPNLFSNA